MLALLVRWAPWIGDLSNWMLSLDACHWLAPAAPHAPKNLQVEDPGYSPCVDWSLGACPIWMAAGWLEQQTVAARGPALPTPNWLQSLVL